MSACKPHLLRILSATLNEWFVGRRHEVVKELQKNEENLAASELKSRAEEIIKSQCVEKILESIAADEKLAALGQDVPELLAKQLKTSLVIEDIKASSREALDSHVEAERERFKAKFAILSRVRPWLERQMRKARCAFVREHRWDAHSRAADESRARELSASAYFLARDVTFCRDREPMLRRALEENADPVRTFEFPARIWSPKNWVVREFRGEFDEGQVIPTVVETRVNDIALDSPPPRTVDGVQ